MRSNSLAGRLLHFFTGGWTHVAMINNPSRHEVLDSLQDRGVLYRRTDVFYKKIVADGTKSSSRSSVSEDQYAIDRTGAPQSFGGFLSIPK
ncbi:MAG: hypothetical protein EXS67_01070 [Candidatus Margulisbacteria bacterium]|nr:hypothetical protein [Candidatus Margulisiibacteriota bacterium]